MYSLDRATGQRFWRAKTGPVGAPLALVDGILLVPAQRGQLFGLNPSDGSLRWKRRMGMARIAPVSVGRGAVVVATVDSLYRLTASDGEVSHRVPTPGTIVSPWLAHRGLLVAGTTDSQVVAISPADLTTRWSTKVDAPVLRSPVSRRWLRATSATRRCRRLYVASRRGTLFRVAPDSAHTARPVVELEWPVTAPLTAVDGLLLLGGADGMLRALRPDGREAWRIQLWSPIELGPVALEDGILAIGGNGDLHRYRQ